VRSPTRALAIPALLLALVSPVEEVHFWLVDEWVFAADAQQRVEDGLLGVVWDLS
jgi:hypothetical protein